MAYISALDDLPTSLAYLKPAAEDIAKQDQDLVGCGEVDTAALDTAIRCEMDALFPADVEVRCAQDLQDLRAWLPTCHQQDDPHVAALWVIAGLLTGAWEILNPTPDDEYEERFSPSFEPRRATIQLPDDFTFDNALGEIVASNGIVKLVVREIDAKTFALLSHEFSTPERKTTVAHGTVIYPKAIIKLGNLVGTKNTTEQDATTEITYLLECNGWFAMVRLEAPVKTDVTSYEQALGSIVFL